MGLLAGEWVQALTKLAHRILGHELNVTMAIAIGVVAKREDEMKNFTFKMVRFSPWMRGGQTSSRSAIQPHQVLKTYGILQTPPKKYAAMENGGWLRATEEAKDVLKSRGRYCTTEP